jgi:hypothetical protein
LQAQRKSFVGTGPEAIERGPGHPAGLALIRRRILESLYKAGNGSKNVSP